MSASFYQISKMVPSQKSEGQFVELPSFDNLTEYTKLYTENEVRSYAARFVDRYGQCLFAREGEHKFNPYNCRLFKAALNK